MQAAQSSANGLLTPLMVVTEEAGYWKSSCVIIKCACRRTKGMMDRILGEKAVKAEKSQNGYLKKKKRCIAWE